MLQCTVFVNPKIDIIIIIVIIIIIIIVIIITTIITALLLTLGSICSTNTSGAEQISETNNSNQTYQG